MQYQFDAWSEGARGASAMFKGEALVDIGDAPDSVKAAAREFCAISKASLVRIIEPFSGIELASERATA